ncbi:MAG: tRNA pseudouridine(55) synthase TruB [Deltaproteobacteria bacterium RIFOXYA12_FULL_58_15]|nr:MAG: tRNA pseudouridine(55) synthase TruB [Deltaproteobacteria bacterium RIFOXYA12_FULL_58_15]
MDGILVIDKPAGPTSHDIVDAVRRVLRQKKVGHTGTLDPAATGALPLVLGSATKIARYLSGGNKEYDATLRLGVTTTTLDSEGEVVETKPVDVTEQQVRAVLGLFVGDIKQIPPMYSAKKMQGKRLYELARQGVEIEREPKDVIVHSIELTELSLPDIMVKVRCSAGTYVRVLAQDVGERLGCGGHLKQLRRIVAGPFSIDDAVTLDVLEAAPENAKAHILPIGRGLRGVPSVSLPVHLGRQVASGQQLMVADLRTLDIPDVGENDLVALWLDDGTLLALTRAGIPTARLASARRDEIALKTERVFAQAPRR